MHILVIPSWYPKSSTDINGCFFREQAISLTHQQCKVGVISLQLCSLKSWRSILAGKCNTTFENDDGVLTYRKSGVNWFPRMPQAQTLLWRKYGLKFYEHYVARHGAPDILHVHSMLNAGLIAEEVRERYGVPYVVTEHSSAYARRLIKGNMWRRVVDIAKHASLRFAVSSPFSQFMEKYIGDSDSTWGVMPNSVNDAFFDFQPTRSRDQEFTFINVCHFNHNKNIDQLIKAFNKAFRNNCSVKLRIGGDGKLRESLECLVKDLGIDRQVEFLGMLSRQQVLKEIASADAFVLSSRYETFGVVLIEALALGKPVIATRCGGPEDIVRQEDGILVPINDEDALAEGLQKLYNDHHEYQPEEIRAACRERFGQQVVTNKLIERYSQVLVDPVSPKIDLP